MDLTFALPEPRGSHLFEVRSAEGRPTAHPRPSPAAERLEDRQFLMIESAFERHGGLATGEEIARRLRQRSTRPLSTLARWIVDREIASFVWQAQTRIPIFQFTLSTMEIRPEIRPAMGELSSIFDGWELALWFATPNCWLDEARPVDVLNLDASALLRAARTDRFIARG